MSNRYGTAVQIHEIGVGCLLWLPPFDDSGGDSRPLCQRHTNMRRHLMDIIAFDHPVVILNIRNRYGTDPLIRFITLSSYRGNLRSQCGPRYLLENGQDVETTSNFCIWHRFVLSLSRFDAYDWGQARPCDYRLTRQSYLHLMERLGLHADAFYPTPRINNGLIQASSPTPPPTPPPPTQQLPTVNRRRENNPFNLLDWEEYCP